MLPELVRRHILERNSALHNRHLGARCFILGTDHSIAGQNIKPLQNELCISTGNFFTHPDYTYIKPRYHCLDPFCNTYPEEAWDAWMQSLDSTLALYHPEVTLFFSLSDIKRNSRFGTFADVTICYFDCSATPGSLLQQGIDLTQPILGAKSASVLALQAAVYMGCKEIYLLGCDHDRLLHLHAGRRCNQEAEHAINMHLVRNSGRKDVDEEVDSQCDITLRQQYEVIGHSAAKVDILILNATKSGLPDIFPRVDLGALLSPPPMSRAPFQRKIDEYGYFGDFSQWSDAVQCTEGYDAPQILEKIKNATLQVKSGQAAYERDSVVFHAVPYEWVAPLAYWLPRIASEYKNALNLIDFGGSLGSVYFALRGFLTGVSEIKWHVVEQPHVAACGNALIADGNLTFYSSLSQCAQSQKSPVILLSASLAYLEKPCEFINELIAYNFDYIIFDRTPFIEGDNDRLTAQFVSPEIYEASYPAWFFSKKKFLRMFAGTYEVVGSFASLDDVNIPSDFGGFVFKRIHQKKYHALPAADVTEWARYNELGDFITRTDTPLHKQHFLANGCETEEEEHELKARRIVNSHLSRFAALHQLITIKSKPTYAIFDMSSRCNLNCLLCNTGAMKSHFQGVERGTMSFEVFKAGLDKLLPEIESLLLYNWGEPFLNQELFKCIAYASAHEVQTQLSTNMMLYTEEIGLQLIKAGLDKLIVSCDGLDQETYQKYRCGGSLEKIVSSVENLVALKQRMDSPKPYVEMQFVVFAFNEHQMQEYKWFWESRGVDSVHFIQMSYMSKHGRAVAEHGEYIPSHPDFQPHFPYGTMRACSELYNHVTIDWNGDWYTCCFPSGMKEYRIANIVTDDFWEVWNGNAYRYSRELVKSQKSGEGYCEAMCHDCTGIFPHAHTKRYWL